MAEKLEDLKLPNVTVQKIIKEVLPDNVAVAKDARSALSTAASVFVLYVTAQASREAQKANRKTLLGQDVTNALKELDFEEFVPALEKMANDLKASREKKRPKKSTDNDGKDMDTEECGEEEESPDLQ